MAEAGDIIQEYKNAKPAEKVVIVVGVLAVGGVALYLFTRGMGSQAPAGQVPASNGSPAGQAAGFPMAGNNPVVPSGVTPLYDGNGNLIGWQNPPGPGGNTGGMPPTTGPIPAPIPIGGPIVAPGPGGINVNKTPLISDLYKVWFGKGNQIYYGTTLQNQQHFNIPSGWTLRAGSNGRYWLINGNQQQLLTNKFQYGQSGPGMIASSTHVATTASRATH